MTKLMNQDLVHPWSNLTHTLVFLKIQYFYVETLFKPRFCRENCRSPKFLEKCFWSGDQTEGTMTYSTVGPFSPIFLFWLKINITCSYVGDIVSVTHTHKNRARTQFSPRGLGPQPRDLAGRWGPYGRSFYMSGCFGCKFNERSYCPKTIAKRPAHGRPD